MVVRWWLAMRSARLRLVAALATALSLGPGMATAQQQPAWQAWQHVPGVVDVGVRADGSLLVMAAGRLFSIDDQGAARPFAAGSDGFSGSPDAEPYFVVTPGLRVDAAGCAWNADDVFALDLGSPPGVTRVDASGHASPFTSLAGADTLGGIAFDAGGTFGQRLLVTGTRANATIVFAIDCRGVSTTLTDGAPPVEGGIAVAPASFGRFAGDLIAPDENSGQVWAIAPSGQVDLVALPNLAAGGDTGVESLGFVPAGFFSGGAAYLADRATADNPFPGTDSLLRLSASALAQAGVQEGDLLVATEGGGATVAIRCADACASIPITSGNGIGHIEGHLVAVPGH